MLRMLGFEVTGPDIHYKYHDTAYLDKKFSEYSGFQDFPWCFEWKRFVEVPNIKYIILKRDFESWWMSFLESYGKPKEEYISYPYMKLSKIKENKLLFRDYFETYYNDADAYASQYPGKVLSVNVKSFGWEELCDFLDLKPPRNIFGQVVKKPHINKKNAQSKQMSGFKTQKKIKDTILKLLGQKYYLKFVLFLRKE